MNEKIYKSREEADEVLKDTVENVYCPLNQKSCNMKCICFESTVKILDNSNGVNYIDSICSYFNLTISTVAYNRK